MNAPADGRHTLDELCALWQSGDREAQRRLFADLRVRFPEIAKHRVVTDDVEDVVQEGLRIVHLKLDRGSAPDGILPWSLAILRNVLGNYYKERGRRRARVPFDEEIHVLEGSDPSTELERRQAAEQLGRGLRLLARSHPRCARLFQWILESLEAGGGAQAISGRVFELARREQPELTRGAFYVALHRCRARLREVLDELAGGGE